MMFGRRSKANADAPADTVEQPSSTESAAPASSVGVDTLPAPPADARPSDDTLWADDVPGFSGDADFVRYANEAVTAMAASTFTATPEAETPAWTPPPGPDGVANRPDLDAAAVPTETPDPFGPVSDPFGGASAAPAAAAPAAAAPSGEPLACAAPPIEPQSVGPTTEPIIEAGAIRTSEVDSKGDDDAEPVNTLPVRMDHPQLPEELQRLKVAAQDALVERMGARLYDRTLLDDQVEDLVTNELNSFLAEHDVQLDDHNRLLLTDEVINDVLRHGPIEPYLQDDTVSEIMVNGLNSIYVERNGRLQETSSNFLTEPHLRQIIERIVSKVGRRIDESSPMVDARLPDGSRVNAVVPPLAVDGPSLTIRKFAKDALSVDDLIRFGTLTRPSVEFLAACVRGRLNVLVSGGTGTGKTTMLNVLSSFIPDDERIVTLEDAVELQLHQRHIVRLESRPANVEGKGQIAIRDLVRNSLRMRPDRVIIGECRGGEALDMLQAMNTGHDGSLSTLHANGPRDALSRLETLCLMAGMELPVRAIREQIGSAVHIIVHISRLRDGSRRVTHITEVVGLEGDVITLSDIFTFDFDAGFDEEGHYLGTLQPTGLVPGVVRKLEEHGVKLNTELFDTGEDW